MRKVQQDLLLKTDAGDVRHIAVGKTEGAAIIVLYLHGQGGSRKQGADDFTFGGNFNRSKRTFSFIFTRINFSRNYKISI